MAGASESRQQRLIEVMSGRARGIAPAVMRAAAAAASGVYQAIIDVRNNGYDTGRRKIAKLPRPVISVGNISVGGTGKTVLAAEVARWVIGGETLASGCDALPVGSRLNDAGDDKVRGSGTVGSGVEGHGVLRAAVLTRGYKGGDSPVGSDEAAMLRQLLPGVAVEADPDRLAAGQRLLAGPNPPDVFILDDGFQHRRLHRDLDIVAVDATMELEGPLARLLPRGLLREPIESLGRADFVVLTRADQAPAVALDRLTRRIKAVDANLPILRCRHAPTTLLCGAESRPIAGLAGKKFLAFCGIGNPAGFAMTAKKLPGECVDFVAFDDHYVYTGADLARLAERGKAAGADLLLTTAKDYVKLAAIAAAVSPPVWAVQVAVEWLDPAGGEALRGEVMELATGKGK